MRHRVQTVQYQLLIVVSLLLELTTLTLRSRRSRNAYYCSVAFDVYLSCFLAVFDENYCGSVQLRSSEPIPYQILISYDSCIRLIMIALKLSSRVVCSISVYEKEL